MTNIMSERARRLRKEKTDAERRLWCALRELNRQGFHFRQQAPVGPFIADFAELTRRIIIEVDGGQHGETESERKDIARTAWLHSQGFRVLRFWNRDVLTETDGVMTTVLLALGVLTDDVAPSTVRAVSGGGTDLDADQ